MSAWLLGFAFRARMGTQARKLVLLKLVDACEDDGSRIFPAVATIAAAAECSPRQVQRELAQFRRIGLIRCVREGGQGPGSTTEYRMDIAVLERLAKEGWDAVAGGAQAAENDAPDGPADDREEARAAPEKGDAVSPFSPDKGDMGGAKGDKLCHPTPPIDPLNGERGAQAREPAGAGRAGAGAADRGARHRDAQRQGEDGAEPGAWRADPGFVAIAKAYPNTAGDHLDRAYRHWCGLDEADRASAFRLIPALLADRRTGKRKTVVGLEAWLRDRRWEFVDSAAPPAAPGEPERVLVQPFGRPFWHVLFRRLGRGERCAFMVSQAVSGSPYPVVAADMPDAAEESALVAIPTDGPEASAWADHLAARGLRLPLGSIRAPYLFVPARWPPGREAAA